jgi:hypothetical protein
MRGFAHSLGWAIVGVCGIVLAVAALRPTSTSSATPPLGPLPTRCSPALERGAAPGAPNVFGSAPLWFGLYAPYDAARNGFHLRGSLRTSLGWRVKILWLMRRRAAQPIRVETRGPSGGRLVVELGGQIQAPPRTRFVLDPRRPGAYDHPAVHNYPSYGYFRKAGCYSLRFSSGGKRWIARFGVGR